MKVGSGDALSGPEEQALEREGGRPGHTSTKETVERGAAGAAVKAHVAVADALVLGDCLAPH